MSNIYINVQNATRTYTNIPMHMQKIHTIHIHTQKEKMSLIYI